MSFHGVNNQSGISQTTSVQPLEQTAQSAQTTTLDKMPDLATASKQQANKPTTSMPSAFEISGKYVLGAILLGTGITIGAALAPITIPLGLLGAGIGFAVGKGLKGMSREAPEIGAFVGGSIGSLLTGALVIAGYSLIKNSNGLKEDRADAIKDQATVKQEQPAAKPSKDKVASTKLQQKKELPDPDGEKSKMDTMRTVLNDTSRDDLTRFEEYEIVKAGPKYTEFYETFNQEIDFKITISSQKRELQEQLNNYEAMAERKTNNETFLTKPLAPEALQNLQSNLSNIHTQMKLMDTSIIELKTSIENKSGALAELENNTNEAYRKAIE